MATLHPSQPDEAQILTSYLLHPSPLSTILPYTQFLSLVPKASAAHPTELKRLYRDLQFQRDITIDDVRRHIENECRRSLGLQARLARELRRENGAKRKRDADDAEGSDSDSDPGRSVKLDIALHGPTGGTLQPQVKKHNHTADSLLSALAAAKQSIISEVAALEAELGELKQECEEQVGGLSDLRYGKFANRAFGDQTVEEDVTEKLLSLKREFETGGRGWGTSS